MSHQDRREPLPKEYQFPTPKNCYRIDYMHYHLVDPGAETCRCGEVHIDDGNPLADVLIATQIH